MDQSRSPQELLAYLAMQQDDVCLDHVLRRKGIKMNGLTATEVDGAEDLRGNDCDRWLQSRGRDVPHRMSVVEDPFLSTGHEEGGECNASGHTHSKAPTMNTDEGDSSDGGSSYEEEDRRITRRKQCDLNHLLNESEEAGWIPKSPADVEDRLRQWMGDANWPHREANEFVNKPCDSASQGVSDFNNPITTLPRISKSSQSPIQDEQRTTPLQPKLPAITLHSHQQDRLDHFLDRCIWRVDDMIAEAEFALASRPTREEVEMYIEPLDADGDDVPAEEFDPALAQDALMRDIDGLLGGGCGLGLGLSEGVQPAARTVVLTKMTRTSSSRIPKLSGLSVSKSVRRSEIPVLSATRLLR